jgi:hypothetical protein
LGGWVWHGGVGIASGKSLEAAFSKAMDGSREDMTESGSRRRECSGEGGSVAASEGGWDGECDCSPSRWMASLDAFSRMYFRSESVRPGRASETSTRRTSVGEPYWKVRMCELLERIPWNSRCLTSHACCSTV